MTFQQIFAVLRARWIVALALFTVAMSGVLGFTLLMPKTYTATASIIVDIRGADPIAGMASPSLAAPSYLMTQIDVLTSKRVAMRVIKNLKFGESADMQQKWRKATKGTGNFEGWLAALLRGGMEARPSRGSNVIFLSYQAADPAFASTVANAFVQAYLDVVSELRTNPAKHSTEFFDVNTRSSRAVLEAAQKRLSDYQQNQSLLVTDERLDIETQRLNELSNQLTGMQAVVMESSSKQSAAMTRGDTSPDVMANPLVASLKADLLKQQTMLEQLSTRLGEEHPQVQEIKTGIADTSRKLDAEIRRTTTSLGVGTKVNQSRVDQVRVALDEQRSKVLKMKAVRDEAAILARDVDSAQRAYDGVLSRMSTSRLESQANEANISALEYAVAPSIPSAPNVTASVTIGALVVAALAVAVALTVEYLDRRLRVRSEVEKLLGQPLIGAIPSFKKRKATTGLADRFKIGSSPRMRALPYKA